MQTLFTIGYGDSVARLEVERKFAITLMLAGAVVYALHCEHDVGAGQRQRIMRPRRQLAVVIRWNDRDLPEGLRQRIKLEFGTSGRSSPACRTATCPGPRRSSEPARSWPI